MTSSRLTDSPPFPVFLRLAQEPRDSFKSVGYEIALLRNEMWPTPGVE